MRRVLPDILPKTAVVYPVVLASRPLYPLRAGLGLDPRRKGVKKNPGPSSTEGNLEPGLTPVI